MLRIRDPNKSRTMTAAPSKYPQGKFRDKGCGWCGCSFSPMGPSHKYCGEECKSSANSDKYYRKQYGISLHRVEELYKFQGGKCAICEGTGFKMREDLRSNLHLDHCHITGEVRGLLCPNCNRALGLLGDSVDNMRRAIEYVSK